VSEPQTDIVERLRAQYPAGGMIPSPLIIEEAAQEIERLRGLLDRYRWRPISEMHEDFGPCVVAHFDDPGHLEIWSNLDDDFEALDWSIFVSVPSLTHEEAARLRDAQEVAAEQEN
jgi:hypothetical protein